MNILLSHQAHPKISEIPVVLLCGGQGILIDESGKRRLKGLVQVNQEPLVFHLFKSYIRAGFKRIILCGGLQIEELRQTFQDRYGAKEVNSNDFTLAFEGNRVQIEIVDTGLGTSTGSRLIQVQSRLLNNPTFCVNYSDSLSNLNLKKLVEFHFQHKKIATLIAVRMPTRFRILGLKYGDPEIRGFAEKTVVQNDLINGGYYVFNQKIFDSPYLGAKSNHDPVLETHILEELVKQREIVSCRVKARWQHLDSEKDIRALSEIASSLAQGC